MTDTGNEANRSPRRGRRERAPKPIAVPLIVAALGAAMFFLGILVDSVDLSALGALLFLWGLCSGSVLFMIRRRLAARRAEHAR
jgi:hypothetical protein